MPRPAEEPFQTLPDPLTLLSDAGEVLEANAAFQDLLERCGASPSLTDLFGAAVSGLLQQALREGRARASLPLACGPEPRPYFKLSLACGGDRGPLVLLLTDVTEEMDWGRRLQERGRDLAVLREIGAQLSGTLEVDTLVERVYEQTSRIAHTANFYLALYDRESQLVSFPRYVEDGKWREMTSRPLGSGLTEYVLNSGKPLLLDHDVAGQARALGITPVGRPCLAWLGAPMLVDGEPIGVIAVQDYEQTNRYDQYDLEILAIIAAQAAAAIRNSRLLAGARRAYEELAQTQFRLLEAERARGVTEAVGAMNHEVNNPLAAIAGHAQLLLRRADGLSADARDKIEGILEAARRIQRVTTKMATLIQATSMPYPGKDAIIDVKGSVSRIDPPASGQLFPAAPDGLEERPQRR